MIRYISILKISVFLLLAAWIGDAFAQFPTMTYDGNVLKVIVPTDRLSFVQADIKHVSAVSNAFTWDSDGKCLFMPGEYEFVISNLEGETGDVCLPCKVNEKPYNICVEINRKLATGMQSDVSEHKKPSKAVNNIVFIVLILTVILLLLVLFIIFNKKKRKKKEKQPIIKPSENIFSMIEDKSVFYENGLQHVKNRIGEYLTFDLREVFKNTTIEMVYFSTVLIKQLYDFFNRSLESTERTNETGCYLLGCWDYANAGKKHYNISLEYMVEPGDDADFGEYSLNFGKKIGINMGSVIDNIASKSKRDYVHTCWMHSHPGLGLFLSHQDLIVQQQLVYSDHKGRLLAIVVDTNTAELKLGFFTPKEDGSMNNKEDVKKWFSFEEIYKQGKEANQAYSLRQQPEFEENDIAVDSNYMRINIHDETIHSLDFSAKAINQMNDVLYFCKRGVVGYFYGDASRPNMLIENCLQYENEENLGCIIEEKFASIDSIITEFANEISSCRFFIVYRSDDEMQICLRDNNGRFSSNIVPVVTSMSQMKEWIRRKRI